MLSNKMKLKKADAEAIDKPKSNIQKAGAGKRVRWAGELHDKFVDAVEKLGEKAIPSNILKEMNVQGITRQSIASHLQSHRSIQRLHSSARQIASNEQQFLERRHSIATVSQLEERVRVPSSPARHSFCYASNYFDDELSNMGAELEIATAQQQQQELEDYRVACEEDDFVLKTSEMEELDVERKTEVVVASREDEKEAEAETETEIVASKRQVARKRTKKPKHEQTEHRKTKFLFQQRLLQLYSHNAAQQALRDQIHNEEHQETTVTMATVAPAPSSFDPSSISSPSSLMVSLDPFSPSGLNMMAFLLPQTNENNNNDYQDNEGIDLRDNQQLENMLFRNTSTQQNSPLLHQHNQGFNLVQSHQHFYHHHQKDNNLNAGCDSRQNMTSPSMTLYRPPMPMYSSQTQPLLHPPPQVYCNCCNDVLLDHHHQSHSQSSSPSPPPPGPFTDQNKTNSFYKNF